MHRTPTRYIAKNAHGLLSLMHTSPRRCQRFELSSAGTPAASEDPRRGGTPSGTPSGNEFKFTGQELDAFGVGVYYLRNRYYSKTLMRYLSQDPLGLGSDDLNLYAYVHNDPINFVDPFGLSGGSGGAAQGSPDATRYLQQRAGRQRQNQLPGDSSGENGPGPGPIGVGPVEMGCGNCPYLDFREAYAEVISLGASTAIGRIFHTAGQVTETVAGAAGGFAVDAVVEHPNTRRAWAGLVTADGSAAVAGAIIGEATDPLGGAIAGYVVGQGLSSMFQSGDQELQEGAVGGQP